MSYVLRNSSIDYNLPLYTLVKDLKLDLLIVLYMNKLTYVPSTLPVKQNLVFTSPPAVLAISESVEIDVD